MISTISLLIKELTLLVSYVRNKAFPQPLSEQEESKYLGMMAEGDAKAKEQTETLEDLYDYNMTRLGEYEKRVALLKKMFAEIGEGCYIEPPFQANWGGNHVHFDNG